jgi:hypothetical protein
MSKFGQTKNPQPQPAPARPTEASGHRAGAPAPHVQAGKGASLSPERIALRAYSLWESRGRPGGTDQQDWYEAERQLRAEAR